MPIVRRTDLRTIDPFPGFTGRIVDSANFTVAQFEIKKGAKFERHMHPDHEQVTILNTGRLLLTVGDEATELSPGDVAIIPPETFHEGEVLEDCKATDVFYPYRTWDPEK